MIEVKTRFRNPAISVGLTLLLLCVGMSRISFQPAALAQQNNPQPVYLKVTNKNIGGAFELTAETLIYGDVKVYLPDDMAAGDTISGTVVAEPKGTTEEERAKNMGVLKGFVLEVDGEKASIRDDIVVPVSGGSGSRLSFTRRAISPTVSPVTRLRFRIGGDTSVQNPVEVTIPAQPTLVNIP
ncbi:MAG: hypothetical protein LC672_02975, partial [Acidobacteria bacterium]|nr:hypothetical protein [Acidobacteriota bacterium]